MRQIKKIVVHYSATYEDQDLGVDDIRSMHKKRGFNDVGYHYVVKRDGTVQKGRPESVVGAHVAGKNSDSIGVCGIGGLNRATGPNVGVKNWTPAQEAAILTLLKDLKRRYPGADVVGHRDLAATLCPGFDVKPWFARALMAEHDEEQAAKADRAEAFSDPAIFAQHLVAVIAPEIRKIVREEIAASREISS